MTPDEAVIAARDTDPAIWVRLFAENVAAGRFDRAERIAALAFLAATIREDVP